jgi:lipopolysaccharide biosynthesis regulator YciM
MDPQAPYQPAKASIQQAADFVDLGMFPEAIAVIGSLSADLREASAARRVLLRAATSLGKWQLALSLAKGLRTGNEADRSEAARALQAVAAEACKRGREDEARHLVGAAVLARPEQLEDILIDERFPEKFRTALGKR